MSNLAQNCMNQGQLISNQSGQKSGLFQSLRKFNSLVGLWISRHRQRKQLASLAPHLIKDLGLTSDQIQREVARPFWD